MEYDVFPDAEAFVGWAIRDAGIPGLNGVYSSIPKSPPANYAVIRRIGGVPNERHRLDQPNLQIDVWAVDKATGHDLAQAARVAVHELEGGTYGVFDSCPVAIVVTAVTDSLGLSFIPDPTTHKDRYIFGLRLVTHAANQDSS